MAGLTLGRRKGQTIHIGHGIVVTIVDSNGPVRINVDAPKDVDIWRGERGCSPKVVNAVQTHPEVVSLCHGG